MMEIAEYETMRRCEDEHWWYWGLRDAIVTEAAKRLEGRAEASILDAGCGTGRTLAELSAKTSATVVGIDLAASALPFLKERGVERVARATVIRLPFADASFDVVVSADVVCCLESPDDRIAFQEFARVLKPGGALILNLPAHPRLRGRHDRAVHIRQRFTRTGLRASLSASGLVVEELTHRNTLLFPIAAAVRIASGWSDRGATGPAKSDVTLPPRALNALLKAPLAIENRWIRAGGVAPFGLSIHAVAVRPERTSHPTSRD